MLGNPRQAKFVYEYIKDGDAKRALLAAGWQGKNVATAASRLLHKPGIRREIESELENIRDATRVTKAYVVAKLKKVAERSMQEEPVYEWNGREKVPTGEYQFDSQGANKSLELLGKSLGIFIDKQVNINISLEDILNASHQLDSGR
jgi:phage terminase small subunit